jgi:hypothetical protein
MTDREELERKSEEGDVFASLELAELIEKSGDIGEARRRYEWMASVWENATAAIEAARLSYEMGDFSEMAKWVGYAAAAPEVMQWFWDDLGTKARSSDATSRSKAKSALKTASDQGAYYATVILAHLAKEQGRISAAKRLYEKALQDGYWDEDPELAGLEEEEVGDDAGGFSGDWGDGESRDDGGWLDR